MHEVVLKIFNILKSITQFLKIFLIFCIMMHLLYWIQDLTKDSWAWTKFMQPIIDYFILVGGNIMSGRIMLFAAVFEFKFFMALVLYLGLYGLDHLLYLGLSKVEDIYIDGYRMMRKKEEDAFNASMEKLNNAEQRRIRRYKVYIETQIKPRFAHRDYNINLEEQNKILLKHLIEKTYVNPEKYGNGYLFSFEVFDKVDTILEIFSKLPESEAPIDYIVCLQVFGANEIKEEEQLKTLIELRNLNKIAIFADTAYRYEFNSIRKFKTMQIGLFQKDGSTFEVHEFLKKDTRF